MTHAAQTTWTHTGDGAATVLAETGRETVGGIERVTVRYLAPVESADGVYGWLPVEWLVRKGWVRETVERVK
jgi:hypothetical protein